MICNATPDDTPAIAAMIRALADYENLTHQVVLNDDDLRLHLFGEYRYGEALIAEEGGEAVGFALFFPHFSTFHGQPGMFLEDLFVYPQYRGSGHGKALLVRLAQICVERGAPRLDWSVLDWNEPSIKFYRSLGAQPMDEWTTFRLSGDALRTLGASTKDQYIA
jgi:GNAT superfamily N-acetyltransferase